MPLNAPENAIQLLRSLSFATVRRNKKIMSACVVSSDSGFFFSEAGQEPGPTASRLNWHSPPQDNWGSSNKKWKRDTLK